MSLPSFLMLCAIAYVIYALYSLAGLAGGVAAAVVLR